MNKMNTFGSVNDDHEGKEIVVSIKETLSYKLCNYFQQDNPGKGILSNL